MKPIIVIITLCILLFSCKKPNTDSDKTKIFYSSYKLFLDSLLATKDLVYAFEKPSLSTDTFYLKNNVFKIVNKVGDLKQNRYFYGVKGNKLLYYNSDSCINLIEFGKTVFEKVNFNCVLAYDENSVFSYHNTCFTHAIIYPSTELPPFGCVGSGCRVNSYPVFAVTKMDTSYHLFTFADDITKLKYGDLNKDNYLDFLDISHGFDLEDINILESKDKKFKYQNCPNSECYKITAITFKEGRWEKLKDINGKIYYLLIKLDHPLDINSSFEILDSFWLK